MGDEDTMDTTANDQPLAGAAGAAAGDARDAANAAESSETIPSAPELTAEQVLAAAQALETEHLRAIEAIVMAATEPVEPAVLAQLLDQPAPAVNRLCQRLAASYEEAGHGFQLVRVAGGWRYQTHPDTVAYVERFVLDGQRARLSGAALETLAIVAYKQPISRAQIASIRGVDPDGVLRTLQSRGYVDQIARDPGPGQAALWGTTVKFLEKLGMDSLADLPVLAGFVPGADVVEALELGLRVTPVVEPLPVPEPVAAPSASAAADTSAADSGGDAPTDRSSDVEPPVA